MDYLARETAVSWFSRWRRRLAPRSVPRAIIYSRAGCHLCDAAIALLDRYRATGRLELEVVDIDGDPALRERYDQLVPVVVIDGVERFRGRVNEVLLGRLLATGPSGTPPAAK